MDLIFVPAGSNQLTVIFRVVALVVPVGNPSDSEVPKMTAIVVVLVLPSWKYAALTAVIMLSMKVFAAPNRDIT